MAAGKGTRLKSRRPKVLHEIGGQALLLHVIAAARTIVPADRIFCIIGHEAEQRPRRRSPTGVKFVLQAEQRGTGHALQMLKAHFAALRPDPSPSTSSSSPATSPSSAPRPSSDLCAFHLRRARGHDHPHRRPTRPHRLRPRPPQPLPASPDVTAIVEQKSLTPDQLAAPEINSGIYCFRTSALFAHLDSLSTNNAHGEFYLTDVAAMLVADRERVVAIQAAGSVDEVLGANTIAEMMHLDAAMRLATARRLMAQGVTIFRPETCVIDAEVEVGPDTVIEPYVQLLGATKVGSDCRIRSYPSSQNAHIGDNVLLRNGCIVSDSTIGRRRQARPLRPPPPRQRHRPGSPHRQLRRDQEGHPRQRLQGQPPRLSRRCNHRRRRQHRRRRHHLQLRRHPQAPHHHRRQRLRRLRLHPRRPPHHRRRRLHRRRLLHHRRCPRRRPRPGTQPPDHQARMGLRAETRPM